MKVIQIGMYPPPFGGRSIHIKSLKSHLERTGNICLVFNISRQKNNNEKGVISIRGLIDLLFKLLKYKADIIHIHTFFRIKKIPLGTIGVVIGRLRREKVIWTIHGGGFQEFYHGLSFISKWILAVSLYLTTKIIVVTPLLFETLLRLGIKKEKMVIIPAFLPITETHFEIPEHVEEIISSYYPVLTTVCFIKPRYGIELLIKAVALLKERYPRLFLFIVASRARKGIDEEYNKRLQDLIKQSNLEKQVKFLFSLPTNRLLPLIKASTIFVRPTYVDGDSVSVRESLFLGVPAIASDTSPRPEGTIVFKTGEIKDLYDKLVMVLENYKEFKSAKVKNGGEENLINLMKVYSELTKS